MKAWQLLVLFGVLGIVVYAATRPPQPTYLSAASSTNSLFSLFGQIGGAVVGRIGKAQAPSIVVVPNEGTYRTDITPEVTGNQLTDPNTGKPLTYGTD